MAIINKAALKAQFKAGGTPAVQHMFNLVDSVLVKKDDLFFGKWTPGTNYSQGEIVIYGKEFYCCIAGEGVNPCAPAEGSSTEPVPVSNSFCSQTKPPEDKENWQLMFGVPDEDWIIIRGTDGNPDILYAKVFGNIGMGTSSPEARVHIHDEKNKADFLFAPLSASAPEFVIRRTDEEPGMIKESLQEGKAVFTTDTAGFHFRHSDATGTSSESSEESPALPVQESTAVFINFIEGQPAISIGHDLPKAVVDAKTATGSRILIQPLSHTRPELVCLNTSAGAGQQLLSAGVDENAALLTTNASQGFYIRSTSQDGESYTTNAPDSNAATTLVSIKNDKKVGIATENPEGELDVMSSGGRLVLDLSSFDNPVLKIINIRPNANDINYLAMGANNDRAVLMTDSNQGFVFKKGPNNVTDISRGENLVLITPDKKMGIGINPKYELDLFGNARMFSLYLNTDDDKIESQGDLTESVINKLMKLKPMYFTWKDDRYNSWNTKGTKNQIGLFASNVDETFPELVRKDTDNTMSVAYPNLVAVLTKAIQEQQKKLTELEARIAKLEGVKK